MLSFASACAVAIGSLAFGALLPLALAAQASSPGEASDGPEAQAARRQMVDGLLARNPGLSPRVAAALRAVPRHLFVPGTSLDEAYADHAFPIGYQQTISQPTVVAIMSDALSLTGTERVLEIGTGSGYQAALLSRLARKVYSIEIVAPLGESARRLLAALGYANVEVRVGDGYAGWPEAAPFDRIILTAAPLRMPAALREQLADGGILVAPLGERDEQVLERWTKRGDEFEREELGGVRFVPMVSGTPRGR
jgi:protein-L-isoaspartate(D-aspartate) O-methyltransferase